MSFIKLTKQTIEKKKISVYVNTDRINYIQPGGDGSRVTIGESDVVYTEETPDEIIAKVSVIG